MKFTRKTATPMYIWLQILYWATHCALFTFASAFLLDKGYTNAQIGLILALSYALSTTVQPIIASMFQRFGLRTNNGLAGMYLLAAVIALVLLLVPMGKVVLAVLFVIVLTLQSAAQPVMNTLAQDFNVGGVPINFGLARGIGSGSFSLSSAVLGAALRRFAPALLPLVYVVTMLLLVASLVVFRAPEMLEEKAAEKKTSGGNILKDNPRFVMFLLGSVFIMIPHMFIENFMLQIMQTMGGTSAHQGVAMAVAGIVELPTMMLYSRLSRRFGYKNLLTLAGWAWMCKTLIALFATGPAGMYAAEVMQMFSLGIYTPAVVEYVAAILPRRDFMKGQALAGSSNMLGCLIATSLGGVLIDHLGAKPSLMLLQVFAVAGAILLTLAMPRKKKTR